MMSILKVFLCFLLMCTTGNAFRRQCVCRNRLSDCGETPTVLNGEYELNANGKTAVLICDEGFQPTPPTTITCESSGNWTQSSAICQSDSFGGTSFVAVFNRVTFRSGNTDIRRVMITASEPTVVNLTSNFNSIGLSVSVTSTAEQDITPSITLLSSGVVTNQVLRITSEAPINVHILIYRKSGGQTGTDSFLLRPIEQLGTEYILITTESRAQLSVAAVEDGTNVIITNPDTTTLTTQTLDNGEVYSIFLRTDSGGFTGTVVTSDKPVAVFCGGYFATVPSTVINSRDTAAVQMIPVEDWYTLCIIAPFFPDEEFFYEVVGSVDGTNVNMTRGGTFTSFIIDRSGVVQELVTSNEAVVITSDNPILVALFSVTSAVTGRAPGDPSMVQCIDPDKYLNVYTFFVTDLFDIHYVRIIIQDQFKSDLILNGQDVLSNIVFSLSVTVPYGDVYAVLYVVVDPSVQYVLQTTSGARFGADAYGIVRVGQYAHNLGMVFA